MVQAVLRVALKERKEPEFILQMLGRLPPLPATAERRAEVPFLEEGLAMSILAEAARRGHVELALRGWDFLEYSLLPLDLPHSPAHCERPFLLQSRRLAQHVTM